MTEIKEKKKKADISDFISGKQIHTDPSTWYMAFHLANVLFSFSLNIEISKQFDFT